jgi:hypothetical protein
LIVVAAIVGVAATLAGAARVLYSKRNASVAQNPDLEANKPVKIKLKDSLNKEEEAEFHDAQEDLDTEDAQEEPDTVEASGDFLTTGKTQKASARTAWGANSLTQETGFGI